VLKKPWSRFNLKGENNMPIATVTLPDGRGVKLGRKIPIRQKYNGGYFFVQRQNGSIAVIPALDAYYDASSAAPPPASVDWTTKAALAIARMYLNDTYGDCVIASAYHQEGLWSGNESGTPVLGTDAEVLSSYHTICGPGDNGCDISTVLDYTRDKGLLFGGVTKKIDAYVSVDHTNKLLVQAAIDLFGTLKLGIDLPSAWANSPEGGLWDVTSSGIVGGHDVPCAAYDAIGVTILTWAGTRKITWAAFMSTKWLTECYAPLAPDWYNNANLAPNGIDAATLKANLAAIANGTVPPFGPPPAVPMDWLI
jgi:hypothetical protein